jgi:hypothetical protein
MSDTPKTVTLYSVAETGAQYDAAEIFAKLHAAEIPARITITIPADLEAEANAILSGAPEIGEVDPTRELDWETIAVFHGIDGEMQAAAVTTLLESAGIDVTVIEAAGFPSLPYRIRVAKKFAADAKKLLADAESLGPQAAEQEFDKN